MKNLYKKAFSLFEVIVVLGLLVCLYTISVILIDPPSIFRATQSTQRVVDIKSIKSSIDRYFSEDPVDGNIRSIYSFNGFLALRSTAINGGLGSCPNAVHNGVNEVVLGAYDIDTKGPGNFIDISSLINPDTLPKVPKDPMDASTYKACIDSASVNQLVIFAPNSENTPKTFTSVNTGSDGVSENLILNPSFEFDISQYNVSNGTITRVASGASQYFPKIGGFYGSFVTNDSSDSFVSTKVSGWIPGSTLTASVSVDRKKYDGKIKLELQEYDGANWNGSEILINNSGRYAVTRTLKKNSTDVRIVVSSSGATGTFYVDGFQVEKRSFVTSYIDGSRGTNYIWNGEPNASTSKRLK